MKVVVEEGNAYLTKLKCKLFVIMLEQIKSQRLTKKAVFDRMGIDKEHRQLGILEVKEALKAFDPAVSDATALGLAKYLLRDDEAITSA
jgi:hypothetical protein